MSNPYGVLNIAIKTPKRKRNMGRMTDEVRKIKRQSFEEERKVNSLVIEVKKLKYKLIEGRKKMNNMSNELRRIKRQLQFSNVPEETNYENTNKTELSSTPLEMYIPEIYRVKSHNKEQLEFDFDHANKDNKTNA